MSFATTEPPEVLEVTPEVSTSTDALPPNQLKTQLVYIQTPTKLPFPKSNTTNNMIPQLQFATLPTNIVKSTQSRPLANSGVILKNVGKTQQLVLTKPGGSGTKFGGTYLTMIKSMTKVSESEVLNSGKGGKAPHKYVIAPMPSVLKNNRLPVTVTTNSLQPKIRFMPLALPAADSAKQSMFNIHISDEHIKSECKEENLLCDEVIDSPVKSEKEYELSIIEEPEPNINDSADKRNFPKYTHGVSILKKNYQGDKPRVLSSNTNTPNPILLDPEAEPPVLKQQKTERRRKSNFSYRRDYDDMEIVEATEPEVTVTKVESSENADDKKNVKVFTENNNMKDDCDLEKVLKWDEGVGSLPGSNLKFIINEFNLVEYVTREEHDRIMEKRLSKVAKSKKFPEEDLHCVECGCYGLPSEFVTSKYCSLDCQETGKAKVVSKEKEAKARRRRKKGLKRSNSDSIKSEARDQSDEEDAAATSVALTENTSNENSQDKFSYPWTCSKKGFSWTKYLDHIKAKAAPVKLFKDDFPCLRNGFRAGMRLEGVDPHHPSYFCVLSVAEVCGYRLRLHFDGYAENYDFWLNADSMDIFPVGWCEKHDRVLQTPPRYSSSSFNWVAYLKLTRSTAAPKHLFVNRSTSAICPNGFRIGMKLEAVDRKNNSALVCVATVRDMMDNRILVHFDSWDDIYDYWVDPTSPYIHPVGWSDQNGHSLTPPNDYPDPENFAWPRYLKETKSVAAPARAFKQRPTCGFRKSMRLECVDKRVPQLIRVATVDDVRSHQIRIHFDGWPDRYSYWVDDDSTDIHPVGWCQKTGHPIEGPLTPDDVYDFLECPTVGCRGIGHTQGPKFPNHSEQVFCPYAEDNIDAERVLPDRLLSPDRLIEAVVPVSREPSKVKPRLGRPPKYLQIETAIKTECDEVAKKPKRKYTKRQKFSVDEEEINSEIPKAIKFIQQAKIEPAANESWQQHSLFLQDYVDNVNNVRRWNSEKVTDFVASIPGCEEQAERFRCLQVDGEAFLSLNQRDLIDLLKVKVGPAIKLYNIVIMLRQKAVDYGL